MSELSPALIERMKIKPTLKACERAIERAAVAYAEAGGALAMIRDEGLYKEKYSSFEDYCRERWGWSKSRAYQQIDAAKVYETLADRAEASTMVDAFEPPRNERTARELVPLRSKPAQLAKVWETVVAEHGPDAGARQVRAVVAEILPPRTSSSSSPSPRSVGDAVGALKRLIGRGFSPAALRQALDEIDREEAADAHV